MTRVQEGVHEEKRLFKTQLNLRLPRRIAEPLQPVLRPLVAVNIHSNSEIFIQVEQVRKS